MSQRDQTGGLGENHRQQTGEVEQGGLGTLGAGQMDQEICSPRSHSKREDGLGELSTGHEMGFSMLHVEMRTPAAWRACVIVTYLFGR